MEKEIQNIKLAQQFKKREGKITKGMFKCDIPSPGRLYKKDREMMKECIIFWLVKFSSIPGNVY